MKTNFSKGLSITTVFVVTGASVVISACNGSGSTQSASVAQDTTMQTASGQVEDASHHPRRRAPERSDNPAATVPSSDNAAPAAAPPATVVVLPSQTQLAVTSNARVCTNTYHVGDTFSGNTSETVNGNNGGLLPAGSPVMFRVTQVKNSNNMTQSGEIGIAIDSIGLNGVNYPAQANITSARTDKVRATGMGQEATKAGIGAAAGGILGQVIGHNAKATIIGAAAGLAAGGAAALATTKYDFCIPQNGRIALQLTADTRL